MYIYKDHRGGFFTSDVELTEEELYCEACNDSDTYIGYAETKEEALKVLKDGRHITEVNDYVRDFLKKWD